jgi:hypothetical protein
MNSVTMKVFESTLPISWIVMMFGWFSAESGASFLLEASQAIPILR